MRGCAQDTSGRLEIPDAVAKGLRLVYSPQAAEKTYGFKVMVEDDTGRIIGAHLVGPHADAVIKLFALAIRHELTADDLKTTMFAYPNRRF